MKLLLKLLTLLLVAVWPLATSHCDLEQVPGFAFLSCADETSESHQDNDCETDNCASVESGFYKTEDSQQIPAPPSITSELLTAVPLQVKDVISIRGVTLGTVPSDLPRRWQFSFRTALPPRAPSVVS